MKSRSRYGWGPEEEYFGAEQTCFASLWCVLLARQIVKWLIFNDVKIGLIYAVEHSWFLHLRVQYFFIGEFNVSRKCTSND